MEKQKKRVIGAGILCIVANMFSIVFFTMAWFQANRVQKSSSDNLVISPIDYTVECKVYGFDDDYNVGLVETGDDAFALKPYDMYILSRNEYASKLIEITINSESFDTFDKAININIPSVGAFSSPYQGNVYVNNWISNVIHFKTLRSSYILNDDSEVKDIAINDGNNKFTKDGLYKSEEDMIYQEVKEAFEDKPTVSYVNLGEENPEIDNNLKNNNISLTKVVVPAYAKSVTFFIQFEYDVQLVNYFYNHYDVNTAQSTDDNPLVGQQVNFISDISQIKISSGVED